MEREKVQNSEKGYLEKILPSYLPFWIDLKSLPPRSFILTHQECTGQVYWSLGEGVLGPALLAVGSADSSPSG